MIDILQKAEKHQVFLVRGHSSLFRYVIDELRISESAAYTLITVSRKAREVPELKNCLRDGTITLSNARRVASVLNRENKSEWIKKACELSHRELEKEIARVNPKVETPERASYISEDRVKLELGLSELELLKLQRVQDLLSQSKRRPVSLEETLETLTDEYLKRHDPLERAKRQQAKKETPENRQEKNTETPPPDEGATEQVAPQKTKPGPKTGSTELVTLRASTPRKNIPLEILHQVNLRDEGRCVHLLPNGERCNQSRWIEVHHKIPVSEGGLNHLDNLVTLCAAHHRLIHRVRPSAALLSGRPKPLGREIPSR